MLERPADLAREARLDGFPQGGIALAHDLVHDGGLHAGGLELGEGLSGIDRVELLRIAHQHHAGDAQRIRDPEQVAGLDGGSERSFVDHQRGPPERGTHVAGARPGDASFGDTGVTHEEALEGLGCDTGLALQRPRGRGRGREAPDLVALLLHERAGAPQHGGLAAARIALDADGAVLGGQDELHGLLLPVGEWAAPERLVDSPPAHGGGAPPLTGLHQSDRLALVGQRPVGGEQPVHAGQAGGVQGSALLQRRDLALDLAGRRRARAEGERGGQQIGAREHCLAFREVGDGPARGPRRRGLRRHRRPVPALRGRGGHPAIPGDLDGTTPRAVFPAWLAGGIEAGLPRTRFGNQPPGIESEGLGLFQPALAERHPVDVALGGAGEERRALGEALVLRRPAQAAFGHGGLDLGAARGICLNDVPRDPRDLEPSVGMGLLDAVSELREFARELVAVEGAQQHLRGVEPLVRHGAPFSVFAPHHVGDHRVGMKRGVEVAGSVMPERRDHRLLVARTRHAAGFRVLHPGLGGVLLEPVERAADGAVVGVDHARVAADQRRERDGFGGAEGQVAAGTVVELSVVPHASEPLAGAVGHAAFEDRPEGVGIDRSVEAEPGRAAPGPGAGLPVLYVVLRVVSVAFVVGSALLGRGDGADRGDHVRIASGGPRPARPAPRCRPFPRREMPAPPLPALHGREARRPPAWRFRRFRHPAGCPRHPPPP